VCGPRKQRELLEVVLMTESDAALKAMIEDSLAVRHPTGLWARPVIRYRSASGTYR
jgi:hypothetical protein